MKNILLCCLLITGLAGCMNHSNLTKNTVNSANKNDVCEQTCHKRFDACKVECTDNCSNCNKRSNQTSRKNYRKYVHEECVKGGFIARDLNSYRDPLQCKKVSCNCAADLDSCIQSCNGVIRKQLKAPSFCC